MLPADMIKISIMDTLTSNQVLRMRHCACMNDYILGFTPFYSQITPTENQQYCIIDFPPVLHSNHVYGGPFVAITCNI